MQTKANWLYSKKMNSLPTAYTRLAAPLFGICTPLMQVLLAVALSRVKVNRPLTPGVSRTINAVEVRSYDCRSPAPHRFDPPPTMSNRSISKSHRQLELRLPSGGHAHFKSKLELTEFVPGLVDE